MSYRSSGFTLIEMIVVMAIFGIVTTILVANLPTFRDQSSLDLVAQEVAINIRGAQVFGGSGRVGSVVGKPTYGIHFDLSTGPTQQFLLFRDGAGSNDGEYDAGSGCGQADSECVEAYAISNGYVIESVCESDGNIDNGATSCPSSINGTLDILFTRPSLEPRFTINGTVNVNSELVLVTVKSLRNNQTRLINVWRNGQIATSAGLTTPTP